MANTDTAISWTDATVNPLVGCTQCSPGCLNCYAMNFANRLKTSFPQYEGVVKAGKPGIQWTGLVNYIPNAFDGMERWRKGKKVFVCSMSDIFHEAVCEDWIREIWRNMVGLPMQTFQLLTKRPERLFKPLDGDTNQVLCEGLNFAKNIWVGVTVENGTTKARIDVLRQIPAAIRFISFEPLVGDVGELDLSGIDWVIVGGESGSKARRMDLAWARSIIRQADDQNVPVFFKQLGNAAVREQNSFLQPNDRISSLRGGEPGEFPQWLSELGRREFPMDVDEREAADAMRRRSELRAFLATNRLHGPSDGVCHLVVGVASTGKLLNDIRTSYSLAELAQLNGCTVRVIEGLISRGKLKAFYMGRSLRVRADEWQRFMEQNEKVVRRRVV